MRPPSDDILCLATEVHVIRKGKIVWPLDDLVIRFVRRLGAEGRISDEALEHDRTE